MTRQALLKVAATIDKIINIRNHGSDCSFAQNHSDPNPGIPEPSRAAKQASTIARQPLVLVERDYDQGQIMIAKLDFATKHGGFNELRRF